MSRTGSLTSGLHAALLFARGRAEGLRYIEADTAGARRSFWAMALCLPAIVCLRLMNWVEYGAPAHAAQAFSLGLLGDVIAWLAFAVLTFQIMPLLADGKRWPRFITAWNWCNVVENLLLVVGGLPALLGAPAMVSETAQIFFIGWALWIEWFAIKEALDTNGLVAGILLVLDQLIGLVATAVTLSLLPG